MLRQTFEQPFWPSNSPSAWSDDAVLEIVLGWLAQPNCLAWADGPPPPLNMPVVNLDMIETLHDFPL